MCIPSRRQACSSPRNSNIKTPADLAGVPISVGYQSGSHYSTVQALEQYMKPEQINLSFGDGLLFKRMELLIDRKVPAVHLFSGPYYFAEQLGFRKVIDNTFMIGTMIHGDPDPEDLRKFFRALRRAQRDIDLRPELYTHYYKNEFPERWHVDDGYAPLGPRRASRLRAVHQGSLRRIVRVDRRSTASSRKAAWARASTSARLCRSSKRRLYPSPPVRL